VVSKKAKLDFPKLPKFDFFLEKDCLVLCHCTLYIKNEAPVVDYETEISHFVV